MVMIFANDTDIIVLGISFFSDIRADKLWVSFGIGNKLRNISIHDICSTMSSTKAKALPELHALVVVVVRLEHSHGFIDSFDNHSTASGPASCRRCRPPGNAVSGHSSTMCLVVWWLSPQGQAGDAITPNR